MIRESIARHLDAGDRAGGEAIRPADAHARFSPHASHILLAVATGSEGDGACLIEPAVGCNHCGYCQSYGH